MPFIDHIREHFKTQQQFTNFEPIETIHIKELERPTSKQY